MQAQVSFTDGLSCFVVKVQLAQSSQTYRSCHLRTRSGVAESISGVCISVDFYFFFSLSIPLRIYNFSEFFVILLLSQYALRSVYPASYTHIGQEFGTAVSMDVAGALFVGAPNQLSSSAVETQNGAVHVLQLHSSPSDSASQPSTAINSLSPLNKPIGTSCASLLQQVRSTSITRYPVFSHSLSHILMYLDGAGVFRVRHLPHQAHGTYRRPFSNLLRHAHSRRRLEHVLHKRRHRRCGHVWRLFLRCHEPVRPQVRRFHVKCLHMRFKSAFHQSIPFGLPQHRFY